MKGLLASLAILFLLISCEGKQSNDKATTKVVQVGNTTSIALSDIHLPPGFSIKIFANIRNARSLTKSQNGTIYVGSRAGNKVVAIKDTNNDGVADQYNTIASGLNTPNGVAFKDGDLYVAEINRILRFPDIEQQLDRPPRPEVVYDDYPTNRHHGWKYIAFGPDGRLYVPVGAPCNVCKSSNEIYASITALDIDTKQVEVYANGVRNSVGFDWHPETGHLWFTDNGRDMMGDDIPPCELNSAAVAGMHFGFPYCHGGYIADPKYGKDDECAQFSDPMRKLGPHVAPLGMKFYTGDMFPSKHKNQIFIAEHGSWNRSTKIGYRVTLVKLDESGKAISYEPFAFGWLNDATQQVTGRPVDILILDDGSMLVSDDYAGLIYRISYAE